jgi:hypothetical protein
LIRLLKYLYNLFSKSNADENEKVSDLTDKTETYKGLDLDKIELLLKKYNCEDQEELVITLKEREFDYEEFTEDEKIFYDNPEWEFLKSFADLGWALHRENLSGRSLAVRELIENRYQVLLDEHGNPFKELINYTLMYFDRFFYEKPIEAEKLLRDSFPTMHLYIKRQISNQQNEIHTKILVDEQKAYDEFLVFCSITFSSLYSDKRVRDLQIIRHFKIFHKDLIRFIDAEQAKL